MLTKEVWFFVVSVHLRAMMYEQMPSDIENQARPGMAMKTTIYKFQKTGSVADEEHHGGR